VKVCPYCKAPDIEQTTLGYSGGRNRNVADCTKCGWSGHVYDLEEFTKADTPATQTTLQVLTELREFIVNKPARANYAIGERLRVVHEIDRLIQKFKG
jgi:hypothetical protein